MKGIKWLTVVNLLAKKRVLLLVVALLLAVLGPAIGVTPEQLCELYSSNPELLKGLPLAE